jgi:hypothetical protein
VSGQQSEMIFIHRRWPSRTNSLNGYAGEGKPMLLPKLVKAADGFAAGLALLTKRGKGFVKHPLPLVYYI